MLAAKLLAEQGISVEGVCFISNFFNAEKAIRAADILGIELKVVDISEEELALVKNPPSGHGKRLNPCIDCHALMVSKAAGIADKNGFAIVATGEVLGQRPFSQNKDALARVSELAGTEILRPLSAKLLPETSYEREGLVRRGQLLDIRGRSRERQMELAAKFGLKGYSSPAGGCLLTDPEFSVRLSKMIEAWPDSGRDDAELLKYGRIFWLKEKIAKNTAREILLVIGRHKQDNANLEKLARKGDIMVELKEETGPTSLIRGLETGDAGPVLETDIPGKIMMSKPKLNEPKTAAEIIDIAALLTGFYAVKARGKRVKVGVKIRN